MNTILETRIAGVAVSVTSDKELSGAGILLLSEMLSQLAHGEFLFVVKRKGMEVKTCSADEMEGFLRRMGWQVELPEPKEKL